MSLIGDREPTRDEVDLLAGVVADAQRSGVRYGPDSLARHILRAGYRLVDEKMPPRSPIRRRGDEYPRRVVLVLDEPGVRDVVQVTGLSEKRHADRVASGLVEIARELWPWRDVYRHVLPADVSIRTWLEVLPMQLGPPYPTVRELRDAGLWEAWSARLRYKARVAEFAQAIGGAGGSPSGDVSAATAATAGGA